MALTRANQDGVLGSLVTVTQPDGSQAPSLIPAFQIVDPAGNPIADDIPGLPYGATGISGLANVANGAAVATLANAAGKTTYLNGFQITALGATAAGSVTVTVAGLLGGSQQYALAIPAGVLVSIVPLIVPFARPLAASAANTAITITVPAFGAGNTSVIISAQGFQL